MLEKCNAPSSLTYSKQGMELKRDIETRIDTARCISDEEFEQFKKIFKGTIPEAFEAFYRIANGGGLCESDVEAEVWKLPVHGFIPITHGSLPIERLIQDMGTLVSEEEVWECGEYLPFAYDYGGQPLFLSLKREDYGRIYLFEGDGMNLFEVAENFSEFLQQLYGENTEE